MTSRERTDRSVKAWVLDALRPALTVGRETTVGDLRSRFSEPSGPTAVLVEDPDPRIIDALTAIRSELPDHRPASEIACCESPLLEVTDDLERIVDAALDREPEHRGHDLLFTTHRGLRLLSASVVTELVAEESALARQVDALTGLPGRAAVLEVLEEALLYDPETVAVAFIDLDRFKAINDLHGHSVGDRVLQVIAKRLRHAVRANDVVGRIGGDEFIAVMRVTGPAEARMAALRIVEHLADPVEQTTTMVHVGTSVGVALGPAFPGEGEAQRLIADADALMYLAKQRGGGVLVAGDLSDVIVTRSQLAEALATDALELQYQPIVPLDGRPIRAVEALVRWPTPDGGTLGPAAFVPLAEATGQILDLDWWALQKAIHQIVAWDASERDDTPHDVHVNLSALTLSMPGLVSHVGRLLAMAGVHPSRLTLEITESAIVTDIERARDVLVALDELGVRTAIDDYGVGQSSLAQISKLPVSALKIDRAFIGRLAQDEIDRSVVRVVRALADELALDVVAEGVESMEQALTLMGLGITHAQGWLWSRAMDARSLGDDSEPQKVTPVAPIPPPSKRAPVASTRAVTSDPTDEQAVTAATAGDPATEDEERAPGTGTETTGPSGTDVAMVADDDAADADAGVDERADEAPDPTGRDLPPPLTDVMAAPPVLASTPPLEPPPVKATAGGWDDMPPVLVPTAASRAAPTQDVAASVAPEPTAGPSPVAPEPTAEPAPDGHEPTPLSTPGGVDDEPPPPPPPTRRRRRTGAIGHSEIAAEFAALSGNRPEPAPDERSD